MQQSVGFPHSDGTLFQSLKTTKKLILSHGRRKVGVPEIESAFGAMTVRMLEYLFWDTGVQIGIFQSQREIGNHNLAKENMSRGKKVMSKVRENDIPGTGRHRGDAILIQMEGMNYAGVLKHIKEKVNPPDIGVEIKDLKKTKTGELILTVKNRLDKAEKLRQALKERAPEASASLLSRKKILHVKDMDEITSIGEIKEAISNQVNIRTEEFEFRALRTAYGGRQNATIIMCKSDANKLIKTKTVVIGWSRCRIMERKQELRCSRCWE